MSFIHNKPIPDKELHSFTKRDDVKAMLTELAKEYYLKCWHIALNCLQAGVSIGLKIAIKPTWWDNDELAQLQINEYSLFVDPDDQGTEVVIQLRRGREINRWSISRGQSVIGKTPNKNGYFLFQHERTPSSRNDKYYQKYRFVSANEAYSFWVENRSKIVASHFDRQNYIAMMQKAK